MILINVEQNYKLVHPAEYLDWEVIDNLLEDYERLALLEEGKLLHNLILEMNKDKEYLENLVHFCNTGKHI